MKKKQDKQTLLNKGKKFKLYTVVFFCGLCVMVLELVGSRMIAPFFGSSIIVWTSLIGIIMASLAAGYYAGGRIADARPKTRLLAAFIATAALWVALLAFIQKGILGLLLSSGVNNIYALSIIAALLFFAVPSFSLAAVSPFIIRLFAADKSNTADGIGGIAGRVSAFSTMGSIAGTFLGGFILISFFSVTVILLLTAFLLSIAALLIFCAGWKKTLILCLAAPGLFAALYHFQKSQTSNMAIETMYNSLFVAEYTEEGRRIRALYTDSEKIQGRMFVDNPGEMAAEYLNFIADNYINENTNSMLMLGGGVYVLPRWLSVSRPDINIDIVEIDPGITQAARDFFYLGSRAGQRIFHEDARYFINRKSMEGKDNYDIIFQDTYGSPLNVPFQLATAEYFNKVKPLLGENGVFILNFIGNLDSDMFRALYASVREAFALVRVFPVNEPEDRKALQNILLTAYKTACEDTSFSAPEYRASFLQQKQPVNIAAFTDSFAPVERYTLDMVR